MEQTPAFQDTANETAERKTQAEADGIANGSNGSVAPDSVNHVDVYCGPLLNYRRTSNATTDEPTWHGSVLIVTPPGQKTPELSLRCLGPVEKSGEERSSGVDASHSRPFTGEKLYQDPRKAFWRFQIDLPFQSFEARWEYHIPGLRDARKDTTGQVSPKVFVVPSKAQSMRVMFHSCNGFSVGTDMDVWKGPVLWSDVLRLHADQPFHVMIGGGDQIYQDSVRVSGPLKPWTEIKNPKKRHSFPFTNELRRKCDDFYYDNYVRWYGTEPFSSANGQIPQINIWDDHDIIDGFGSYTDRFMRCPVFRGIGGVAHKYYLLFQHHIAPPKTSFAVDSYQVPEDGAIAVGTNLHEPEDTFVMNETIQDDTYIIGPRPGPYVEERSRSLYCQLGKRFAFLGIDARTERTRHQINYPDTYEIIFDRLRQEFTANKEIKHLILLLGVPIAYPRLQWLENILKSPIIGPIRFLNKRFGIAGGLFNKFDGSVDLLDDLDDHYTARQHKKERKDLIHRLQDLAKQYSVRIVILGGDVHLGAVGRFYSSPKLGIPLERDWRYMPNIISSAITNKPPPASVANLLARRNKIHHLDHDTDETLLELFDHDPGMAPNGRTNSSKVDGEGPKPDSKTTSWNHCTMPSRNYAIIAESHGGHGSANGQIPELTISPPTNSSMVNGNRPDVPGPEHELSTPNPKNNPRQALHTGEVNAGTAHPAASGLKRTGLCGEFGIDVSIRVEISAKDVEGRTQGYGISIPALDTAAYKEQGTKW